MQHITLRCCEFRQLGARNRAVGSPRVTFGSFLTLNNIARYQDAPYTSGICERLHKSVPQEIYQVAFRKKLYDSKIALRVDLDNWLRH